MTRSIVLSAAVLVTARYDAVLPRKEVIRLMAGAMALVAPWRNEGFGRAIVEAGP